MADTHSTTELLIGLTGNGFLIDSFFLGFAEATVFLVPLILILMFLKGGKARKDSIFIFLTTIAGIVVSYGLGLLYFHQKPPIIYETLVSAEPGNSFPSQHTATLFSFALGVLLRKRKTQCLILGVIAVLTGFSRVIVGHHFVVDILGALIAALLAGLVVSFFEEEIDVFATLILDSLEKIYRVLDLENS